MHRRRKGRNGKRGASPAPAPGRVKRSYTVSEPSSLWVADITYLPTWEGSPYLAVVVDAFSRRAVGPGARYHLHRELVLDAAGMAIFRRIPDPGQVHHSDRRTRRMLVSLHPS